MAAFKTSIVERIEKSVSVSHRGSSVWKNKKVEVESQPVKQKGKENSDFNFEGLTSDF